MLPADTHLPSKMDVDLTGSRAPSSCAANSWSEKAGEKRQVLTIDAASSMDDIEQLNARLRSLDANKLKLDFSAVTGRTPSHRVSKWGPLLSNLLLNEHLRDMPFEVVAPDFSATAQFARSGLMFALARHETLTVRGQSADFQNKLTAWRSDWRPVAPKSTLFEIPTELEDFDPKPMGDKVVAFLNPAPSRIDVESRENAIYPWLRDLLGSSRKISATARMELLKDVSAITSEFLDNIRDHANSSLSYMTLSAMGTGKTKTLQLCIVDNGCGIPTSAHNRNPEYDPADYLLKSLNGSIPRRSRGRGDGLAKVCRRTEKYSGTILIATGPTWDDKSIIVDHSFAESKTIENPAFEPLGISGTVAVVQIPLASILPDS